MKKIKKNNNNVSRVEMDYPVVVDMDTLSSTLDEDLVRRCSILISEREQASRLDLDLQPWETEICYVQRELKIRADRHAAHEKYLLSHVNPYEHYTRSNNTPNLSQSN